MNIRKWPGLFVYWLINWLISLSLYLSIYLFIHSWIKLLVSFNSLVIAPNASLPPWKVDRFRRSHLVGTHAEASVLIRGAGNSILRHDFFLIPSFLSLSFLLSLSLPPPLSTLISLLHLLCLWFLPFPSSPIFCSPPLPSVPSSLILHLGLPSNLGRIVSPLDTAEGHSPGT